MIYKENNSGLHKQNPESGFTLIELLVAMAIASILLAIVGSIFYSLNKGMSAENTRVALQQSVRSAINVIAADLREVGLDPYTKKRFKIEKAALSEIRFSSDLNMDGNLDDNEKFIYLLDDGQLKMSINSNDAPESLLPNVESLQFRYFRENDVEIMLSGSEVADTGEIRAVEIYLEAEENYWGGGSTENRSYRTLVKCRNLNRL
ncbi:PulJ/GspJ family protein [Desulforegula conservatrix]|uniref:PulJ/GspJ family protein n=1 Tax=Desulforegula conservatrix TaxID=153026 RepID=UPI0003F51BEA|nr:prepilin-type N-terminal cleavage/methylation domain-containing protein [Desulforegula conservatrix]